MSISYRLICRLAKIMFALSVLISVVSVFGIIIGFIAKETGNYIIILPLSIVVSWLGYFQFKHLKNNMSKKMENHK